MNDFLPSRKVTAYILVPIVTIFLLWAVFEYYNTPQKVVEKENVLAVTLEEGNRAFQDQDTDGDGLKDWEEFLYQTDERNPDTDGDGASDGAEVKKGYDPLLAGNGTSTDVVATSSSAFTFYKNDPSLNKTDLLARDVFTAYANLKKGESLNVEGIRDKALENAIKENATIDVEEFFVDDLVATTSSSLASKQSYERRYKSAANPLTKIVYNDLELFARHLGYDDASALVEMNKNRLLYEKFLQDLLQIAPPGDIVDVHLELLNNLSVFIESIKDMENYEQDPLLALVSSKRYIEDENRVKQTLFALSLYFQSY